MRKTEAAVQRCKTMSALQRVLGGKWKLEILYYIAFCDIRRFGALRRQLGEITESSLTKQLRELEADGFLIRHDFHEVPPRVEYSLSDLGKSFMDVISYMKAWGEKNLPEEKMTWKCIFCLAAEILLCIAFRQRAQNTFEVIFNEGISGLGRHAEK